MAKFLGSSNCVLRGLKTNKIKHKLIWNPQINDPKSTTNISETHKTQQPKPPLHHHHLSTPSPFSNTIALHAAGHWSLSMHFFKEFKFGKKKRRGEEERAIRVKKEREIIVFFFFRRTVVFFKKRKEKKNYFFFFFTTLELQWVFILGSLL